MGSISKTRSVPGHQTRRRTVVRASQTPETRRRLGTANPFLVAVQNEDVAPSFGNKSSRQGLDVAPGARLRQSKGADHFSLGQRRKPLLAFCSFVPHFSSAMETMAWTVSTPVRADDPLPKASFSKPKVTCPNPVRRNAAADCSPGNRTSPTAISRNQESFAPDPTARQTVQHSRPQMP